MDKIMADHKIKVKYLDVELQMPVTTSIEAARLSVAAVTKTIAIQRGCMPQLAVETSLSNVIVNAEEGTQKPVAEQVLRDFKTTRDHMDELMSQQTFDTAASVYDFMDGSKWVWYSKDPTFVLEVEYVRGMAGQLGDDAMSAAILRCLPEVAKELTYEEAATRFADLKSDVLWLFASKQARGLHQAAEEIVFNMSRGDGPTAAMFPTANEFRRTLGERVSQFCVFSPPSGSDQEAKKFGKEAAVAMLNDLEKKVVDKSLQDLQVVTEMEIFRWLLPAQDQERLTSIGRSAQALVLQRVKGPNAELNSAAAIKSMVTAHTSTKSNNAKRKDVSLPVAKTTAKKGKKTK